MKPRRPLHLRLITPIAALALIAGTYGAARLPSLTGSQRADLVRRFQFAATPLPAPEGREPQSVRKVAPSLERVSAWISAVGAGVTLADVDGDGLPNDVIHVDPRFDTALVSPAPGTPARYAPFVLDAAPLPYDRTMAPTGSVAGDFNEDGRIDVLVYYWGRTPVAFLRRADDDAAPRRDSFVAVEVAPGGERWFTDSVAQADLDGDGHADLIVGNYFADGGRILDPDATERQTMHNTKSKSFTGGHKHLLLWSSAAAGAAPEVAYKAAVGVLSEEVSRGWTLAIGAGDLDGDLLPEIYFANDFGPDRLLHNRSTPGHLQFALLEGTRQLTTPKSCCLGHDSFKGMGCDFGDVNGDGRFDIYVSNIATEFGLQESHFLWESVGDPAMMKSGEAPYEQASEKYGLSRSGWGWESKLADFDNDGVLEAVQATGFIKGKINRWPELQALGTANDQIISNPYLWPAFRPGADISGHERDAFFARAADGRYYDLAEDLHIDDQTAVARGIATADVDGDGDLDFAIANQWEASYFYRNDCPAPGAFLGLHLLLPPAGYASAGGAGKDVILSRPGHPSSDSAHRPAIGACVKVTLPDGGARVAMVDGGNGFTGRRSPDVHVGLGKLPDGATVRVEICWRDLRGQPRKTDLTLMPGWHTIVLGGGAAPVRGGEQ